MSEWLNKIISLIGKHDHEELLADQEDFKNEIFDKHIWWLVEQVKQLESENEHLTNAMLGNAVIANQSGAVIHELESENERLYNTLKQIRLKAASPGLHFADRLSDIQKLASLDGDTDA